MTLSCALARVAMKVEITKLKLDKDRKALLDRTINLLRDFLESACSMLTAVCFLAQFSFSTARKNRAVKKGKYTEKDTA